MLLNRWNSYLLLMLFLILIQSILGASRRGHDSESGELQGMQPPRRADDRSRMGQDDDDDDSGAGDDNSDEGNSGEED